MSEIVPSEAVTPEAGRWITLVPVEVFGSNCYCHEGTAADAAEGNSPYRGNFDCPGFVYGLSDAVQAWSDCNRARGHIFRVDDTEPEYRLPGETVRVWVADKDLPLLEKTWGEE